MDAYHLGRLIGAAVGGAVAAFLLGRKLAASGSAIPYLAALAGAFVGVGGTFVLDVSNRLGSSDADIKKLEVSFNKGCVPSCTGTGATEAQCQSLCSCVLTGLHARYPSNEQFARWFHDSAKDTERVKKEGAELSTICAQASR